jgi:threonine dehydrogenase-like Zn-dependent dehydrogenase
MKAVTWQGKRDVRVDSVADPIIKQPTDILVRVTTSGICGSDLHFYEVLGPFMTPGDVLGHESIGVVEEVGSEITHVKSGDRVVMAFQLSCGHCFMCGAGLQSQCETTQVREFNSGAAIFGYSSLYGAVPGGQAEFLRVPQAQNTAIRVPDGPPDERYVYLSDVLPAAWQGVEYASIPPGGTVVVLGLGPIGDMATRVAAYRGHRVIGVDLVPERLARVRARGNEVLDFSVLGDKIGDAVRDLTGGRGPDSVIDAVGMEAHGSRAGKFAHDAAGLLPGTLARKLMQTAGTDRLTALRMAIDIVRRGGTISFAGFYGGMADPLPMLVLFDKQIQLRMGQANVQRWVPHILPLLTDDDPLGVESFATHRVSLRDAPGAYERFQKKLDGTVKVLINP